MGFFKSLFKGTDRSSPEIKGENLEEAFRLEIAFFIKEGESEPAELTNKAKEKLTEKGLGDLFLSLNDKQRERIVLEELRNKQESQVSQHFQGQIDDYKRVLKDLGYAEVKSEDILKSVIEELGEAELSEIRQVYIQNEDRAKVREKLKPVIDKASKGLADLTGDERRQIIEEITKQAEEIIYQSLTSEALFETMKLDKSKIWNIAKQWGKKWGLRAALSMGIGVGVSTVLGATVLTGGGALLPLASAIGTGGILSGLNVFENSKWGRWLACKTKDGKRQNKPDEFQKKFKEVVESDKILHSEKLSGVLGNQISIMTSRKARERLSEYDATHSYKGALKGIEPILFGQALTYIESEEEYKDLSINEKEKIAFLIVRLLGEEERNKSVMEKSKDELQKKEPRIYQILEKFNGLRAGSLTAKEEATARQIGLTAGTIALGAGTSAAYSLLRTTEHWGPFKAISAILGAVGLGGAGLVWAKTAEAKKEYAIMNEIDNLLKSAEEKTKDVEFPDPLPESLREDKNLVQARLYEGILARNPALTARAENFIRRVEELEYKYSQGLEEILGEINKDTKAIETRKADDIKRLQKAAKTRKALYVAGFGALGAILGLAGATGSQELSERGGVSDILRQAAGKEVKSISGGSKIVEVIGKQNVQVKANVRTQPEELTLTIRRGQNIESVASKLYQESDFAPTSNQAHIEVARQLVFQYLEEHKSDQKYKVIYDDLFQYANDQDLDLKTHQGITQAMHHVKIKDFNEIYQNKVSNLVHPGEKLTVDENGWIKYPEHGNVKVALPIEHTKGGERPDAPALRGDQAESLPIVPYPDKFESGPRITEYSDAGNVKPEPAVDIQTLEPRDFAPKTKIDEYLVQENIRQLIAQGKETKVHSDFIADKIQVGDDKDVQIGYRFLDDRDVPTKTHTNLIEIDVNGDGHGDIRADLVEKNDQLVAEPKEIIFDADTDKSQRVDVSAENNFSYLAERIGGKYVAANDTLRYLRTSDKSLLFCGNNQIEAPTGAVVARLAPNVEPSDIYPSQSWSLETDGVGGERRFDGFVFWDAESKKGVVVLDVNQTGEPRSWQIEGGDINQALQKIDNNPALGVEKLEQNLKDVFEEEAKIEASADAAQPAQILEANNVEALKYFDNNIAKVTLEGHPFDTELHNLLYGLSLKSNKEGDDEFLAEVLKQAFPKMKSVTQEDLNNFREAIIPEYLRNFGSLPQTDAEGIMDQDTVMRLVKAAQDVVKEK